MWLWHGKQWVTKQTWCQELSFQCWKSRCNCDIWWTRNQGYDVVVRNSYLQETKCIICIIYWSKEQLKGETPMNVWETRVNCVIELLWLCSYLSWFPDGIRISHIAGSSSPHLDETDCHIVISICTWKLQVFGQDTFGCNLRSLWMDYFDKLTLS